MTTLEEHECPGEEHEDAERALQIEGFFHTDLVALAIIIAVRLVIGYVTLLGRPCLVEVVA